MILQSKGLSKLTKNKMKLTRVGESWDLRVGKDLSIHHIQLPTQGGTLFKDVPSGSPLTFCALQDILECEIKWALESITANKASGGDGIPVERFQILKDAALNMPANLENSAVATGLEKVHFHSNPKEGQCQRMLKLLHNCTHLTR